MKILLEGHRLAQTNNYGGIDSYWHKLVPKLIQNHQTDAQFNLFTAFLNPKRLKELQRYQKLGCEIHHWWATPELLKIAQWVGGSMKQYCGEHDILHIPEPSLMIRTKARIAVTAHDLMYVHYPQYLNPKWVDKLLYGTEHLAKRANFWICNSTHTQKDLIQHYNVPPGRTKVVYMGVENNFFNASKQEKEKQSVQKKYSIKQPYFIFLGSIEPKKNLDLLLRAYGRAIKEGVRANLIIGGRAGWQASSIKEIANDIPALKERVDFIGFVDQKDLPCLMSAARGLILPSRYEGFGMPILEAMAAKTPVICSDRGAMPEIANGSSLLFDADNEQALTNHILNLDANDDLYEELQERGYQWASNFTWERTAEETFAAYRKMLALPQ